MGAKLSIGHAVETDEFVIAEDVLSHRKAEELLFAFEQIGDTESVQK